MVLKIYIRHKAKVAKMIETKNSVVGFYITYNMVKHYMKVDCDNLEMSIIHPRATTKKKPSKSNHPKDDIKQKLKTIH